MTTTLALINIKTTKVKRLRKNRFCVFFFLLFGFFLGVVLFYIFFRQAYKVFYLQESSHYIQTKHNRKFLPHKKSFTNLLINFSNFLHNILYATWTTPSFNYMHLLMCVHTSH